MNTLLKNQQQELAGSHDPAFLCPPDLQEKIAQVKTDLTFKFDDMTLGQALAGRSAALSDSERHRLVKASKSPTDPEVLLNRAFSKQEFFSDQERLFHNHQHMLDTGEIPKPIIFEHEYKRMKTPLGSPGCRAVIEHRECFDEWRLRTEVDGQNLQPPEQAGERISELLSSRGARKIAESCAYRAAIGKGYKTFVTGTLKPESRLKIANGEVTIQKELSRSLDAMTKMHSRGWVDEVTGEKVAGIEGGLAYCWVVEIPKNEEGEDNPHVHMLMDWRVSYRHFEGWAKRIEGIWGHGYFKLEKIKDSAQAGAYMAKAAGYLSKAQGMANQGIVRGNRYGISACARCPDWETYSVQQLHIASQLIVDVYDHLTVKHGQKFAERKRLNNALVSIPKDKKNARQSIGKKLAKVREELNALPIRCNKYQVLLKGKAAALRFFSWATNTEYDHGNEWLPEKPEGMAWKTGESPTSADSLYHTRLREKIQGRKFWRRLSNPPEWLSWCDREWQQIRNCYQQALSWLEGEPVYDLGV